MQPPKAFMQFGMTTIISSTVPALMVRSAAPRPSQVGISPNQFKSVPE